MHHLETNRVLILITILFCVKGNKISKHTELTNELKLVNKTPISQLYI